MTNGLNPTLIRIGPKIKLPPTPKQLPIKEAKKPNDIKIGILLLFTNFSASVSFPFLIFRAYSVKIVLTLWWVVTMQIIMNSVRISQLYHPHFDRPMTDSNLEVPLKRLTSTVSRVSTMHCKWTIHWEQVDFSLASNSSSARSSSNSVLSSR